MMMPLATLLHGAVKRYLTRAPFVLAVLLTCAVGIAAEAQTITFTSVRANAGGASAQVTITLTGAYGNDEWCDNYGCYYNNYDSTVNPQTFSFAVNGASQSGVQVTSGPTEQCTYWTLQSWQCQQDYQATGTATVNVGQHNTMTASVTGQYNGVTGTATYQYDAPQAFLPPILSTAPHNGENLNPALCGATCFQLTTSYSSVAYISMDTPRSVTLVYTGHRAVPKDLIQVDIEDKNSVRPPDRVSLRVVKPDGNYLRLPNGEFEVHFRYQPGVGANRLAILVEPEGYTYHAIPYQLVATSYWNNSDGTTTAVQAPLAPIRVLHYDQIAKPYGWGWDIAGVQHLRYNETGSTSDSLYVWDGDGTYQYFKNTGCNATGCTYAPPAGEFSTIELLDTSRRPSPDFMFLRKYPDGSKIYYNGWGEQVLAADAAGNTTTYNWVEAGRLASIVDPTGKAITFQYDSRNVLSSITDAAGRVTTVAIDGAGNLVDIYDGRSASVPAMHVGYDGTHLLRTRTDARGQQTDYNSDLMARLTSVVLPTITVNGQLTRPVISTSVGESAVLFNWTDGNWKGTSFNPATPIAASAIRDHLTDPRGNVTTFTHDRFFAAVEIDEPMGRNTLVSRDVHSRPVRVQDPARRVYSYQYNGANLEQVTDSTANRSVFVTYGPNAAPGHVAPSDGPGTWYDRWYSYPAPDQTHVDSMHVRVDGAPGVARYVYDVQGRVKEMGDPANHPTLYVYDTTGFRNTSSVSITGGRTSRFNYDAVGRINGTTDPAGNVVHTEYDPLNRLLRSIGALSDTTSYGYDALFLTSVRDAKGQTYGFQRNALGWVEVETDPRSASKSTRYDVAGNVVSTTDRAGRTVTRAYDALGQLDSLTADGTTTTYATDPFGRFTAALNTQSADTLFFDVLGRPAAEVSWRGGLQHLVSSTYDAHANRTSVTADGYSSGYHFNALDQLDTLTDASGRKTAMRYDGDGLRSGMTLPMGVIVSTPGAPTHGESEITYANVLLNNALGVLHTYDPDARLLDRLNAAGTAGREFRYDPAGRLAGYADYTIPQTCYRDAQTKERICNSGDKTYSGATASYTYDAVGNRSDNNAVLEVGNRLTRYGAQQLTYSPDGELQYRYPDSCPGGVDCHHEYRWNSLGQLTQVFVAGKGWVTYDYDGWGRRIRRSVADSAVTTEYVYDGDNLAIVADQGGSHVTHVYTNQPGIDRPHSVSTGGSTYYYQQDAAGNVVGLIKQDGTLAASYKYDPYGQVVDSAGGVAQPLRFKGREFDPRSGLVYMRARWYDPSLGRFISEDPIGLSGGVNQYAYAGNDPVDNADPSGLDCTVAEAMKVTYTRNEDGDWVETRTCPQGMGTGGITVIGHGLPGGLFGSAPPGCVLCGAQPTAPAGPAPTGPGGGVSTSPSTQTPEPHQEHRMFHGPSCQDFGRNTRLAAGVGAVAGGLYGAAIGASGDAILGGTTGTVLGFLTGVPTVIAAPLAAYTGGLLGGAGGAVAGGIVGLHAGALAGAASYAAQALFMTSIVCAIGG